MFTSDFSPDLRQHSCPGETRLASQRCGGQERRKEGRTPGTHISVMFSGSTVLSNLGNAMMPGIGSLHQILEALHLHDVGQARAALQKPTTSQQKRQSRAMAGPCHLVQDDIASRRCHQPQSG